MSSADSEQEFWARLRAYFETLHALEYLPTDHDEARAMGVKHSYLYRSDGTRPRPRMLEYPPATKEQLQATEEQLGFPLPADLRSLYSIVANGGFDLGPVEVFHGAIGGCGEFANYEPGGELSRTL